MRCCFRQGLHLLYVTIEYRELLPRVFILTLAGGNFLLHFPESHLWLTLSAILPCEARTFLTLIPFGVIVRDHPTQFAFIIINFFFFVKRQNFLPCIYHSAYDKNIDKLDTGRCFYGKIRYATHFSNGSCAQQKLIKCFFKNDRRKARKYNTRSQKAKNSSRNE